MRTIETQNRVKNLSRVVGYLQNTEGVGKVEIGTWGTGESAVLLHPIDVLAQETEHLLVTNTCGLICQYRILYNYANFRDTYLIEVEKGSEDVHLDSIRLSIKNFHSWADERIRKYKDKVMQDPILTARARNERKRKEEEQKDVV